MAHFHVKKKKGRPYLYVREIARVGGKPKVVKQVYIGSPEKVARLARELREPDIVKLNADEFGSLFCANLIDEDIELVKIVDSVIARGERENGPTVGEYFLYCVLNRMVDAVSKNALSSWYGNTAIQQIRPVDIEKLNSRRYWEKWDRVSEEKLERISRLFFEKVWEVESPGADCLLFDTTNYYTFMASDTPSELVKRGKNKHGRDNLRQVGLALLVSRNSRLPLYYRAYPGNMHDSRLFESVMDEMFGIVTGLSGTKERLTVVIDKGMNSEGNFSWIDEHAQVHFVTTYSTYFAEELARTPLERFEPVDTEKNKQRIENGYLNERLLAFRTQGEYWGKERSVVVTYNPATARKQNYTLTAKLSSLRLELLEMRRKVAGAEPHWRSADRIRERYIRECERLHIPTDLYDVEFEQGSSGLSMSFIKNVYNVQRKKALFGKSVIITDNKDWTTTEIVEASLARWQVEERFRISQDDELVNAQPIRHWTDSKIRCHLFSCVVAMTYLRRLELRLSSGDVNRTADNVISDMRNLHSVLFLTAGCRKPVRRLETPTKTQAEVLKALGYFINPRGVLQKMNH